MERHKDTTHELKRFFEIAVHYNQSVQKTNNIQWITVFEEGDKKEVLGISKEGQWIFKDEKSIFVLKDKKTFLYCVKLLEIPYIEIKTSMEERFEEIFLYRVWAS